MSQVLVKATGSFMYVGKNKDCYIRVSGDEAISLRGLAKAIEEIRDMLSKVYLKEMQIPKDEGGWVDTQEEL